MSYIEMKGISKSFGPVKALNQVNFSVEKGEIHALLGENGAGKTTLMKILYGMHKPDSGTISIGGREVLIDTSASAIELGIGMVHQHFMLVPIFTIAENVVAGKEPRKGVLWDKKKTFDKVDKLAKECGLGLDSTKKVYDLSVGECQKVEILKLIYKGAEVLIFDEPTAVLTPIEVEEFFQTLRRFKAEGKTIIIITHKLYEVMDIADRVTILRDGNNVCVVEKNKTNIEELASLMVGRNVALSSVRRSLVMEDSVKCSINNLSLTVNGRKVLDGINLAIHKGEILGIAGIEGNGQSELIKALSGEITPDAMELKINGEVVSGSVLDFRKKGIGTVSEDRGKEGLINSMSIAENAILGYENDERFSSKGIMKWKNIKDYGSEIIDNYKVKATGPDNAIGALSGGNQQKVLVGKVFSQNSEFVICAQPTRGVDVAASEYIHSVIYDYRDKGGAVLLISADLDEVKKLSDTIAVIYKGKIQAVDKVENFDDHRLGILMTGGKI